MNETFVTIIKTTVALNRPKDLRRVMPLIQARRVVNSEAIRDEHTDLRGLPASAPSPQGTSQRERVTAS